MRALDLQSEQFPPTGSITADGARKPLGRPTMDLLVLLVREAIQNSWDARLRNGSTVPFSISSWVASRAQRGQLLEVCFKQMAPESTLSSVLTGKQPMHLIALSDANTTGLAGPTRADRSAGSTDEPENFVQFFRNIGRAERREVGGGTYGFGKASLYMASLAQAICAYTRCRENGRYESRFMAAALGKEFAKRNVPGKFTGRHWWGVRQSDGIVDPLIGNDADALAKSLGLQVLDGTETGTSILVLQPDLGAGRNLLQATTLMMWALVWYCWPHLRVNRDGKSAIRLSVACGGEPIKVPTPAAHPILREYASALTTIETSGRLKVVPGTPSALHEVRILRPRHLLGMLALRHLYPSKGSWQMEGLAPEDATMFPRPPFRHVALLRKPRLVVKYLEGPGLPTDTVGYAGVFLADDSVNKEFAEAEPATHDEWNYATLAGHAKSFVKVALQRIHERIKDFVTPPEAINEASGIAPLGALARQLGGLVVDMSGPGADVPDDDGGDGGGGGGGGGRAGSRASLVVTSGPILENTANGAIARIGFVVRHRKNSAGTVVEASPRVLVLDGHAETEAPLGAPQPVVRGWIDPRGRRLGSSLNRVTVPYGSEDEWQIEISLARNAVVEAGLRVVAEG